MPYARRTLTQLINDTAADVLAGLPGTDPLLRRAVLTILGRVLAGQHHEQYGYLDWIAKQAVPFTSTQEFLAGWAGLKGLTPKAATFGAFTATSVGCTPGAVVPTNSVLTRSDGALYTTALGAVADNTGTVTLSDCKAQVAGSASGVTAGTWGTFSWGTGLFGSTLQLQSPAAGVNPTFVVQTITTIAQDTETDPQLLSRTLAAYSAPPQGGDLNDYVAWVTALSGPTRAWAGGSTIMGAGTVSVYFMIDDLLHTNGIPSGTNGVATLETRDPTQATGDQLVVANALYTLRPVTALVYALAPVSDALNVTLSEVPNDPTIRAGIAAALQGFILREASVGGTFSPNPARPAGTIFVEHLNSALAAVPNLDHFIMTSPTVDFVSATAHIAVPGTITFL